MAENHPSSSLNNTYQSVSSLSLEIEQLENASLNPKTEKSIRLEGIKTLEKIQKSKNEQINFYAGWALGRICTTFPFLFLLEMSNE